MKIINTDTAEMMRSYECTEDCRICPWPGAKCSGELAKVNVFREVNPLKDIFMEDIEKHDILTKGIKTRKFEGDFIAGG